LRRGCAKPFSEEIFIEAAGIATTVYLLVLFAPEMPEEWRDNQWKILAETLSSIPLPS
jgi:hypothetical protein